jgi:hypothetical protein
LRQPLPPSPFLGRVAQSWHDIARKSILIYDIIQHRSQIQMRRNGPFATHSPSAFDTDQKDDRWLWKNLGGNPYAIWTFEGCSVNPLDQSRGLVPSEV